jgi:hypothetical protein
VNLQREMSVAMWTFVRHIVALALDAAIATIEPALRSRGAQSGVQSGPPRLAHTRGPRRRKRSRSELETLSARLLALVKMHPGLRVEEINKRLGTEPRELAPPIRQLIAHGILRAQGHKRSTRYSIAESSAGVFSPRLLTTAPLPTSMRSPSNERGEDS